MVIAQDKRRRRQFGLRQHLAPARAIVVARLFGERCAEDAGHVPLDEQPRLGQQPLLVIGRQIRQPFGLDDPMQRDERIDRQRIKRGFIGPFREQLCIGVVAEILDQQKAVGAVLGIDLGGAEAVRAQDAGDRDIRPDILLGRRRIHQHGAPLAIEEPVIAAE